MIRISMLGIVCHRLVHKILIPFNCNSGDCSIRNKPEERVNSCVMLQVLVPAVVQAKPAVQGSYLGIGQVEAPGEPWIKAGACH